MQKTTYICDGCGDEIKDGQKHLSMRLGSPHTGVAHISENGFWVVEPFSKQFVHFHTGSCSARFFAKELRTVKPEIR